MTNAIQKLLDDTLVLAAENVQDSALANCYLDDLEDFRDVQYLLVQGYLKAAGDRLKEMDSFPRDAMVSAIIEQYGIDKLNKTGYTS